MDLQSLLLNFDGESFTSRIICAPPYCTITENENTINIYLEIPGIDVKTIDINFYNNKIEIVGEKIVPYNIDDNILRQEIKFGDFKKVLNIPICITNRESVITNYENGMLHLIINKKIEEKNMFNIRL